MSTLALEGLMQRGWHAYCMARVKAWRRVLTSGSCPCHVSDWIRSRWVTKVSERTVWCCAREIA
mgnify:CR=1